MGYLTAADNIAVPEKDLPAAGQSSWSRTVIMIWLVGNLILLPVRNLHFPYNLELVDFWFMVGLPVFLLFVIRRHTIINFAYTVPMLLILLGSFASTFVAPSPSRSLIVIVKEVYVFIWFIGVTVLLGGLRGTDLRRVMVVWSYVVVIHGLFIIAQFLWPALWQLSVRFAGRVGEFEHYRSPGLFTNANSAAFFQLMGFVPLVLARKSKLMTIILGGIIFFSLLATGSMGAMLALVAGTSLGLVTIIMLSRNLAPILRYFTRFCIAVAFLLGLMFFVVSQNEAYQSRLRSIMVGRAERSSGGRFALWERGMDAFMTYSGVLWGVGPENFREVDGRDKQLHNDFIAFSVERGLLTALALVLFGGIVMGRAVYLVRTSYRLGAGLEVVVFMSVTLAVMLESLFHQIFHYREMWLVLALLEAMIFKMTFLDIEGLLNGPTPVPSGSGKTANLT